jgi:hypothetical protein
MEKPMSENLLADLLEKELQKPITSAKQSYRILELTAMGIVSLTRQQYTISKELYGNGVPGGVKGEVASVKAAQAETQKDVNEMKLLMSSSISPIKVKEEPPKLSWADTFIKWFADKVLPALVITFLLAVVNGALFIYALNNGWIKAQ